MHELSIATSIMEIVLGQLNQSGIDSPVEKVTFLAGKMHAIVPDSLRFHFDVVKKDHPLTQNAELVIEELPVVARCPGCDQSYTLDEPAFVCPECGTPMRVEGGSEMRVDSIEVEDGPDERNESRD